MAADINDAPLKSGESVTVWVKPREGLKAGEYKDLITYQTEEGADVLFEADFTVKEPENKKAEDHENNEQTDPGETSDPAAEKIYKLTADPTELPFDDLTAGYEKVETTSTVTIKNEGTEAVTLVQPESEFLILRRSVKWRAAEISSWRREESRPLPYSLSLDSLQKMIHTWKSLYLLLMKALKHLLQ